MRIWKKEEEQEWEKQKKRKKVMESMKGKYEGEIKEMIKEGGKKE